MKFVEDGKLGADKKKIGKDYPKRKNFIASNFFREYIKGKAGRDHGKALSYKKNSDIVPDPEKRGKKIKDELEMILNQPVTTRTAIRKTKGAYFPN